MLITSAPALIAREIARAESAQVIRSPSGSGTLSARAPGQMPRKPTPLAGAAATVVVAVPWKSRTSPSLGRRDARAGDLRVADVDPRVDDRDQRAGRRHGGRDGVADDEVAPAREGGERVGRGRLRAWRRGGSARRSRAGRARAAPRASAARAAARDEEGAAGDPLAAVGAGERAAARRASRRSRCGGRCRRSRRAASPGSSTRGGAGALWSGAPSAGAAASAASAAPAAMVIRAFTHAQGSASRRSCT